MTARYEYVSLVLEFPEKRNNNVIIRNKAMISSSRIISALLVALSINSLYFSSVHFYPEEKVSPAPQSSGETTGDRDHPIINYAESTISYSGVTSSFTSWGDISIASVDGNGNPIDSMPINTPINSSSEPYFGDSTTTPSIAPFSIIGSDDRYRVTDTTLYPSRAIVHLLNLNTNAQCTGWMVSSDTVVTAGHCVYGSNGWNTRWIVAPGKDGSNNPFGYTYDIKSVHTDIQWIESQDIRYDWGIIKLNEPIGDTVGWFGLQYDDSGFDGQFVTVRGYPGEAGYQMWTLSGNISQSPTFGLCYSMDTTGGQSGSPVYITGPYYVIGIHAYSVGAHCQSGNSATRITSQLYAVILDTAHS
ncbi:MAG: trypsin-like serine protease [Propionibacteriaceae bacterium]|nr:trypsin-like serine protease [Propionibacteriaceae bacterium]